MATVFKKDGQGPWIIRYFDETGRRREQSSRTTDRRAADRIAAKLEADVALRRDGVVDPAAARAADAASRPLQAHLDAYLEHLGFIRRTASYVATKRQQLTWAVTQTRAQCLADFSLERVERALSLLADAGRSANTLNAYGGAVSAFLSWCVKTGRLVSNPLRYLPRHSVDADRRRERRALTDDELERLFQVAREHGRELWYALAYWAGLRRSELRRLTWGDIDLEHGLIRMAKGKAKRADEVPIHPALAPLLARARGASLPSARVFPHLPNNATRQADYDRARISRAPDAAGRVVDLHALRTTLATNLARMGVAPQVTQRIMRHANYATTLKHYTVLRLEDQATALAALAAPGTTPKKEQQA